MKEVGVSQADVCRTFQTEVGTAVQRSYGRRVPGILEELQGGQSGWSRGVGKGSAGDEARLHGVERMQPLKTMGLYLE